MKAFKIWKPSTNAYFSVLPSWFRKSHFNPRLPDKINIVQTIYFNGFLAERPKTLIYNVHTDASKQTRESESQ